MKLKTIASLIVLGAAGVALQATAQTNPANTSGPAAEPYQNNANAANPNKPKAEVVKKAENSAPVQATKKTAKKAGNAVSRTARKAASSVRGVGENIAKKLPPGPNDPKK